MVAAAVKELNDKVESKNIEIKALKTKLEALEAQNAEILKLIESKK